MVLSTGEKQLLQPTGISVSLIDNLPHDAVVGRPVKRISVGLLRFAENYE